jgi:gamma-glutamyltranspeptidase
MAFRYKCVIILCFLHLAGCGAVPPVRFQLGGLQAAENPDDVPPPPSADPQIVTADREGAAVAKDVLLARGTAADAAIALGFTLAVTSPSAAGIAAAGVCVTRDAKGGLEGVDFRTARMPRGLLALHAKRGNRPWSSLVVSAEALARFGHNVSPKLAEDLAKYGGVLTADAEALATFMTPERRLIAAGDNWRQSDLSDTLAHMRVPTYLAGQAATVFIPDGSVSDAEPLEPGTTGFAVGDASGLAVGCVVTMGRPFGLGSMRRDGGFLFAASSPQEKTLDRVARAFVACIRPPGQSDKDRAADVARCPMPAASFALMP